jgi:hypothetical protein
MASKIRDDGGCGHYNTRFSRQVSTYQEFVEKKKKRVLGFKFLGFLGDGFGVKGRVGVWVVVLTPSLVSHHQFLQPI